VTVRVLSPVEERIAQLAARGQSDRAVAAELGISPQSVERHLSRVFRKLGARTRAELPALLASTRMPGGEPE